MGKSNAVQKANPRDRIVSRMKPFRNDYRNSRSEKRNESQHVNLSMKLTTTSGLRERSFRRTATIRPNEYQKVWNREGDRRRISRRSRRTPSGALYASGSSPVNVRSVTPPPPSPFAKGSLQATSSSYIATVALATRSIEKSPSISARDDAPYCSRKLGCSIACCRAFAKAVASCFGTSQPVTPCCTISRQPGTSVVTIAQPLAAASSGISEAPRHSRSAGIRSAPEKYAGHVVLPAPIFDDALAHPGIDFALTDTGWIRQIGPPDQGKTRLDALSAQQSCRFDKLADAFFLEQPGGQNNERHVARHGDLAIGAGSTPAPRIRPMEPASANPSATILSRSLLFWRIERAFLLPKANLSAGFTIQRNIFARRSADENT